VLVSTFKTKINTKQVQTSPCTTLHVLPPGKLNGMIPEP